MNRGRDMAYFLGLFFAMNENREHAIGSMFELADVTIAVDDRRTYSEGGCAGGRLRPACRHSQTDKAVVTGDSPFRRRFQHLKVEQVAQTALTRTRLSRHFAER